MKVEKTDNKNELKLEFMIEAEKFENAMKKVYFKNAKHFNIPGFRKGKAPYNVAVQYYGKEMFYEDAFNEAVPEVYEEELKNNNIEAVNRPEINIVQMEQGKDLIFTAIVQTKPEVTLGKYKGIQIKKIEYNVSDEDISAELDKMADKNSRLIVVEDRPVEENDIAIIDFEGFVDEKAFEGGKAEKHELTIGSHTFIPGFEEQVVGMKIEEEKDVKVKFPEEYFSPDLSGKDATFKVKLHEIKKKELPTIDDEFAKDVSEFDNLNDLKNSIKERLDAENKNRIKYETEEEALKTVVEAVTIDIPSGMIEAEIDNNIKDIENRLKYQGMDLEKYLKMINKTEEEFRKDYEEQANKNVKTKLVLQQVFIDAKLEIPEEDINTKLEEMATAYNKKAEELKDNEALLNYIKESIKTEKSIEYIVDNAIIK